MPATQEHRARLSHRAGLDGLRGLAVIAVLLYHGGVSWANGGFAGVEVFFVLSGFLITSLLVVEWRKSSTIALGAFWARRARRLLPALFCMVAVIGIYYAIEGPTKAIPGLKQDGIATLLYVSNWHQIAAGASYFAASGPVSPFEHTWSLAIEEQFYIFWPVIVLGALWLTARLTSAGRLSQGRSLQTLLAISVTGAVASAVEVALLFGGGRGLNRVYYGTDTRAAGLLIGASLAIGLNIYLRRPTRARRPAAPASRGGLGRGLGVVAAVALLAVLAMMDFANGSSAWLYPLGLVGLDLAAVVVIAAVVLQPASLVGRILSLRPLCAIGVISYGLYLWHFPLYQWLDTSSTGVSGTTLLLLRLTVTLVVSICSFLLIEQPIRQRRLPTWLVRSLVPLAAGGALATLLIASALGSLPLGVPSDSVLPKAPAKLEGSDPACTVALKDNGAYGVAPLTPKQASGFEYSLLAKHRLTWSRTSNVSFTTCPPKRVLLVGDSLAFTLGVGMQSDEQRYGVELADAGILGCAFTTTGQLDVNGAWQGQSAGCPNALKQWAQDERTLRAQAVVVELGYRDQFDWRINGKTERLGQPAFDASVQKQIDQYVKVLGRGGVPVVFLSVPYTHPPDLPNGSPAPAASPARHAIINSMLRSAARLDPTHVQVLGIDKTVSPGNHYQSKVNGQLCRFDGIHFSIFCSELLQPGVLGAAREAIAKAGRQKDS
jgi:peptidoglycan/LPS O-acetylase OafA/YrhL